MKRLRKALHLALVWITVCLLLVDPAAACRLMCRRCCRCCCAPQACSADTPSMSGKPSQSDAPPMAAIDAGQLPALPLVVPSPSLDELRPAERELPRTLTSGEPDFADAAPKLPATIGPTTLQPAITETSPAASLPATSIPRQPAEFAPSAGASILAPRTPIDNAASALPAPPIEFYAPVPATLRPRQTFEPAAASPTAPPDAAIRQDAEIAPAKPPTSANNVEPPMPTPVPAANATKPPAAISAPPRTQPIQPPAFPPVADDPFALPPPAAAAPQPPSPADDDPFAPLPSPASPPKPAPPLTTEPTSRIAESLLPGTDGRLPIRDWTDNSGQFRVKARLILILDGKVRLLKETGRTTTVSVQRLSPADRQYVAEVTARYGSDLSALDQLAAR